MFEANQCGPDNNAKGKLTDGDLSYFLTAANALLVFYKYLDFRREENTRKLAKLVHRLDAAYIRLSKEMILYGELSDLYDKLRFFRPDSPPYDYENICDLFREILFKARCYFDEKMYK